MADKTKTKDAQDVKDIFENRRFFTLNDKKYYVDMADVESARQADWHYSKTYSEALEVGILTAAMMQDILEKKKILGDDFDKQSRALKEDLDDKVSQLEICTDPVEKGKLADEVEIARNKLFRYNQRASGPLQNTCEQLSDDARMEYYTSAMIKDENGKRVWDSYKEYKECPDVELAGIARFHAMLAVQGVSPNFMEETPEYKARKELEQLGSAGDESPKKKK
jgi:hypothetical protein